MTIPENLHNCWAQSRWFRFALTAATLWVVLRLALALIYAAGLFPPELMGSASLPMDLPVYIKGGRDFQLRQDLYPQDLSDTTFHYPYSPPFAMLSMALLWLPENQVALLGTILTVLAYFFTYLRWWKIFQRFKLDKVNEKMIVTLPVWLIFSAFWGDLSYLNIGIIVALVATLLIEAILDERLGWATLWLTILLISKLMWAFPLALPLLMGRKKFFWKLLACAGLATLAMAGLSVLVAGPGYILQQYLGYFEHLKRISTEFPWHVWTATPFLGYNHSIKQDIIFLLGDKAWVQQLAVVVKIIFLIPLALVGWRLWRAPAQQTASQTHLDLIFALYLGAFIWLDIVWEVLLGIVILPYLLANLEARWARALAWIVFLPYALVDIIQLVSYLIGGESVLARQGGYFLADPSIYLPLIMFIILVFYAMLIRRLWKPAALETTA